MAVALGRDAALSWVRCTNGNGTHATDRGSGGTTGLGEGAQQGGRDRRRRGERGLKHRAQLLLFQHCAGGSGGRLQRPLPFDVSMRLCRFV
jgi:hypothetical protein